MPNAGLPEAGVLRRRGTPLAYSRVQPREALTRLMEERRRLRTVRAFGPRSVVLTRPSWRPGAASQRGSCEAGAPGTECA